MSLAYTAVSQPMVPPRPGAGGYDAEGFIPIPGTAAELYYFVVGEGDPDLLVFSSPFLDGELLPLTETHTVAFVHSRGRGNSTRVLDPSTVSYESELADIEVARAFFGRDRMTLAGTSYWGGLVSLYAARNPGSVERLVLLNPIPPRSIFMSYPANLPVNDVANQRMAVARMQVDGADRTDAFTYCREELVVLSANTVFDLAHLENRRSDPCQYRNEHTTAIDPLLGALFGSLSSWDWSEEIATVDVPALIVYGSHDLAAEEAFEAWAELLSGSTLVRVEEAGHESLLDRPEFVLDAISSFLSTTGP